MIHTLRRSTGRQLATLLVASATSFSGCVAAQTAIETPGQTAVPERCSRVSERDARLACYDRIFPPGNDSGRAVSAASGEVAPAAPPKPGAATAIAPTAEASFGFSARNKPATTIGAVSSRLVGEFTGWAPGTRLAMANGQVWVIDESSRTAGYALKNPAVRVAEGSFGSYYAEIEGVSKTPRVKRVE